MRVSLVILAFFVICGFIAPAQACECVETFTNADLVRGEAASLKHAAAGIDGVVESTSGSISRIKPTRIWFGSKEKTYVIRKQSMCDAAFYTGEQVRITLYNIKKTEGPLGYLWDHIWWSGSKYKSSGCSQFASAMRFREMRAAVAKRARQH